MVRDIKNLHSVLEQCKKIFFFGYKNKQSKYDVEEVAIWQHFFISGKHRHNLF